MTSRLEQLPAELFARIADYVRATQTSLSLLAASSRQCQTHAEAITFNNLRINAGRISDFRKFLSRRRFLALNFLSLDVTVEEHGRLHEEYMARLMAAGSPPLARVTPETLESINGTFTRTVVDFLCALRDKCDEFPDRIGKLCFYLIGPHLPPNWKYLQQTENDSERLFERVWVRLLRNLISPDISVSAVTSFASLGRDGRTYSSTSLWPASWTTLLAHFPGLKSVWLQGDDHEVERKSLEEMRNDRSCMAFPSPLPYAWAYFCSLWLQLAQATLFVDDT